MAYNVVLTHGVFDLLHMGHVFHLREAAKMGDRLVVSVVGDKWLTKGKAVYTEKERVEMLKELRCVDNVILCRSPGPQHIIFSLMPDVYVRGPDYRGKDMPESALLERLGIPVRFTAEGPTRTTKVKKRIWTFNFAKGV